MGRLSIPSLLFVVSYQPINNARLLDILSNPLFTISVHLTDIVDQIYGPLFEYEVSLQREIDLLKWGLSRTQIIYSRNRLALHIKQETNPPPLPDTCKIRVI